MSAEQRRRGRRGGYVRIEPYREPDPPSPWPMLLALVSLAAFALVGIVAVLVVLVTWWGGFS